MSLIVSLGGDDALLASDVNKSTYSAFNHIGSMTSRELHSDASLTSWDNWVTEANHVDVLGHHFVGKLSCNTGVSKPDWGYRAVLVS